MRQAARVGDQVEPFAHRQPTVVDGVVDAIGTGVEQGRHREAGEVVGVDVVGEHVLGGRRVATRDALDRQAVGGVDAGRAQDGDAQVATPPKGAQASFGVESATGAGVRRAARASLVDFRAVAIAIDPRRAYVHKALW